MKAQRSVTLSQDFLIGKTAVTRAQWERFVSETKFKTEAESGPSGGFGWDGSGDLKQKKEFTWRNPGFPQTGNHPVCMVTCPDAEAFCQWLSRKTGRKVTLPTEAQWEYACRAGTMTAWHHGGDLAEEIAWSKQNAGNTTHPVTGKKANPWGLYIGGNVAEWCLDLYGPYPNGDAADPLQRTPSGDKPRRVLRGGSWNRDAKNTRSAARFRAEPRSRNADIGFRVVVLETPAAGSDFSPATASPANVTATPAPAPSQSAAPAPAPVSPAPMQEDAPLLPKSNAPAWFNCLTLACPFAGLGGLAIFLFFILKKSAEARNANTMTGNQAAMMGTPLTASRGNAASTAPIPGISTTNDGFWLMMQDVAPGTLIEYAYTTGAGNEVIDRVVYQPGPTGHFIYTGACATTSTGHKRRRGGRNVHG